MYVVKIYDGPEDKKGITVHTPYIDEAKISSGKVKKKTTGINEFHFSFNMNNPGHRKISPFRTLVKVVNYKNNKVIFDGRVLEPEYEMAESGMFTDYYTAESKLAYLYDSVQRFAEIHDTTIKDFFTLIIKHHNATVEEHKRFKVGNVTVTNTTDNVYRFLGYDKTYTTIKDKLIDRYGGYLRVREEADGTYIDYLADVGSVSDTPIRLGDNMLSLKRKIDPTDVITRLVPLGKTLDPEEEETEETTTSEVSSPRLTIAEVNGGIDYLEDLDLQAEFGIIEGPQTWDDVTLASNLKTKGQTWLDEQKAALESFEVGAIDLEKNGYDYDEFECDNWHYVTNEFIMDRELIQLIEQEIDILAPQRSSLTFGDKSKTLSQYQAEAQKAQQKIINLERNVTSKLDKIGSLSVDLKNAQKDLIQAEQNLNAATNNTNNALDQMDQIDLAITQIKSSILKLETAIEEIDQADYQPEIDAINQKIVDLTARLDVLEGGGTIG